MITFLQWTFAIAVALALAIGLMVKIIVATRGGVGRLVRSLSAAALPILCVSLYHGIEGGLPQVPASLIPILVGATVAVGFVGTLVLHRASSVSVPVAELLLSAVLAWLVLTMLSPESTSTISAPAPFVYSTAASIGAAIYFVLFGFGRRRRAEVPAKGTVAPKGDVAPRG